MNYFYEAVDTSGRTVLGKIDAVDEAEAQTRLLQMGYRPQAIAPNPGASPNSTLGQDLTLMGSMTGMPVASPATTSGQSLNTNLPDLRYGAGANPALTLGQTLHPTGMARVGGITLAGNAAQVGARVKTTSGATRPQSAHVADASTLGGVSTQDLLPFFQQLASLVKSGMTIYTALDNLAPRTRNANLARTAREMADAARNGGRISDVMERYPRIYPDHIVGTVRAGELGGFLEIAMAEIALNYEQNIALYRGSWIPKMMATQSLFALALAIPLFPSLLNSLDFSANMRLYLMREAILLPAAFGIYLLIKFGARHLQLPHMRTLRDSWSLRMPPFGDLQRQAALFSFVRMLRKLYHAGVSPIYAWEGAMNTASNVVIRDKLAGAYDLVQKGASLPDAFTATGLFGDGIEQLILTGHYSGEVVESLDRAADIYQGRVDEAYGKSRFMMRRLGILALLILGGAAMAWMMHSYFQAVFDLPDKMFPELNGTLPF